MADKTRKRSKIPLLLLIAVGISFLLGASLWFVLTKGLTLKQVDMGPLQAAGVTIRLEKGLTVSIDQLEIRDREDAGTAADPDTLIARFNTYSRLFQDIRINRIAYRGQTYTLRFRDNLVTASGADFHMNSTLAYEDDQVQMEIADLDIIPYQVKLSGEATYLPSTGKFQFRGRFATAGINGRASVSYQYNRVRAEMQTDPFTDLESLLARFPIDPEGVAWVTENITAREYVINNLALDFRLKDGKPDIRPGSVHGTGVAADAAVRFHPSLPPVRSSRIQVSFADNQLSFDLDDPLYKDRSIAGSGVVIAPLLGDDTTRLAINIRTDSMLDRDIHELLEAYAVHIPFSQNTGSTQADLRLVFDLPGFELHTEGSFVTERGTWTCGDVPFLTEGAQVRLEDDIVFINRSLIVYRDILQASIVGTVNTEKQEASLTTDIKHLIVQDGEKVIMRVEDQRAPINIRYGEDTVNMKLLMQQVDIILGPSRREIRINNLDKVKDFLPAFRNFPFQEGNATIDFTEPGNLRFEGLVKTDSLPLSSDSVPVARFAFKGTKLPDKLSATVNDGKISLEISEKVSIRLHDYVATVDTATVGSKAGPSSPVPISIFGQRSLIRMKDIAIPTNTFHAEIDGANVTYAAELDQGSILFESNGRKMTLAASEIDAQIAEDFFPFADLEGGRFSLSLTGKDEKNYEGFVEFSNVLIRDFALLNNILSFLNAVPALATFSETPGFDAHGYQVQEGIAHFTRSGNLLTIRQLRTDGTTINTEAEGWIDLEKDAMLIDMKLTSLKDYSRIISVVPWAGYALLGEDNSLSTSLQISGSRNAPEIKTNLPKEIVMLPVNVVKRTIQWPVKLFGRITDMIKGEPEQEK